MSDSPIKSSEEPRELLDHVQHTLDERHAEDIHVLDVRGLSMVTDYFVIATANSKPHLKAVGEELERILRESGHRCHRKAGDAESEWIVLDFVDVVVHIMTAETRDYYSLEKLWSDAPRLGSSSENKASA